MKDRIREAETTANGPAVRRKGTRRDAGRSSSWGLLLNPVKGSGSRARYNRELCCDRLRNEEERAGEGVRGGGETREEGGRVLAMLEWNGIASCFTPKKTGNGREMVEEPEASPFGGSLSCVRAVVRAEGAGFGRTTKAHQLFLKSRAASHQDLEEHDEQRRARSLRSEKQGPKQVSAREGASRSFAAEG